MVFGDFFLFFFRFRSLSSYTEITIKEHLNSAFADDGRFNQIKPTADDCTYNRYHFPDVDDTFLNSKNARNICG